VILPNQLSSDELNFLKLENRPSLPFSYERLTPIAQSLAMSPDERIKFVENPVRYLTEAGLPMSGVAQLNAMPDRLGLTAEVTTCTWVEWCVAAVYWIAVAIGSFLVETFAACDNLAWGCPIKDEHPVIAPMTSSFV
jgi:hypothetical protein